MHGHKCAGHRSPKQSDAPPIPGMLPEPSPAPSQAEANTEDTGVAPIDPHVLNAICSEISNLCFEMAKDLDVKLDIEDLRNSNKLMHESIERVEDSLNAEFCCFENTVMTAINNLTSKVNSGEKPIQYTGFQLEALAGKGKQSNKIQSSLNVATGDQDVDNLTQEELSGGVHIFPIAKGKAPEYSQLVMSLLKTHVDNMQAPTMALVQIEVNPLVDKLSEVLAVHMGKISEKLDSLTSTPPSQGGEPVDTGPSAAANNEVEMVEGPMLPDLE